MKKIIFYTKRDFVEQEPKERITIQLRRYDSNGNYDNTGDDKATFTIHLKHCDMERAAMIISDALMNSPHISSHFDIE